MMRRCIFLLGSLCALFCCHSQNIATSQEFDRNATEYFVEHYELFDLSPLDEREKCILTNQVKNDLTELNASRMVVLNDRYVVKSYFSDYLQLHFGFVKDLTLNKMYFMCLPQLSKFLFDIEENYAPENDSIYALKIPRYPVKINTTLLNDFFFKENYQINVDHSIPSRVDLANQILDDVFSHFPYNKASISELLNQSEIDFQKGRISENSYASIKKFMEDYLSGRTHTLSVYNFEDAGFLIQRYLFHKQEEKLSIEMYFLPNSKRRLISGHAANKYRNCNLDTNK